MASKLQELKSELEGLKNELRLRREAVTDARLSDLSSDFGPIGKIQVKVRRVLRGHLAKVYCVDWGPDSRCIISASQDGKIIGWDPITAYKLYAILLRSSWVMTCAYSCSGNHVACGGLDNTCTIYNLMGEGNKPRIQKELFEHQGYVSSCKFIDDFKIVTGSGDSTCGYWDVETGKRIRELIGHTSDVMKVCTKPGDSNVIASGSCDRSCKIWDLRVNNPCVQSFANHEDDINAVAFFPNGNAVVSASDDSTCRLYDLTADQEVCVYHLESAGSKVCCTSCSFSRSGRVLFVGLDDCQVCIKDTLRGDSLGRLTDHDNKISCLAVSPDGNALCTGSWDNLLMIYA